MDLAVIGVARAMNCVPSLSQCKAVLAAIIAAKGVIRAAQY